MATELERKYRLTREDIKRIAEDLDELGAEYLGTDDEENLIFSSKWLQDSGAVVRIRRKGSGAVLAYKRWVPDDRGFKNHIEYETSVSSADETRSIIEAMGLRLVLVYEKHRRKWKVRDAEVVLDELPFGLFMEIEGTPEAIREAEMILSAEDLEAEIETYPRLTQKYGTLRGEVLEARFDPSHRSAAE